MGYIDKEAEQQLKEWEQGLLSNNQLKVHTDQLNSSVNKDILKAQMEVQYEKEEQALIKLYEKDILDWQGRIDLKKEQQDH